MGERQGNHFASEAWPPHAADDVILRDKAGGRHNFPKKNCVYRARRAINWVVMVDGEEGERLNEGVVYKTSVGYDVAADMLFCSRRTHRLSKEQLVAREALLVQTRWPVR